MEEKKKDWGNFNGEITLESLESTIRTLERIIEDYVGMIKEEESRDVKIMSHKELGRWEERIFELMDKVETWKILLAQWKQISRIEEKLNSLQQVPILKEVRVKPEERSFWEIAEDCQKAIRSRQEQLKGCLSKDDQHALGIY